jgi:hypothetical protein
MKKLRNGLQNIKRSKMDPFKVLKTIELKAQYEVLSEIEDMFAPSSKHKVAVYVDKKMREILKEIEKETVEPKRKKK